MLTEVVLSILAFLFVFSIVVTFHELGHYWAGRIFGVRVEAFSLGFGRTLASVTDKSGTVWRLAAIPLGGYVKFFGDASAASNPDADQLRALKAKIESEHGAEAVAGCYHFKPVWQRAIIAAAGPIANFILAFAIFTFIIGLLGERGEMPIVGAVVAGSPAEAAGIEPGDRITRIEGAPIAYFRDIQRHTALAAGEDLLFTVERGGREIDLVVEVERRVQPDGLGGEANLGYVGVEPGWPTTILAPVSGSPAERAGFRAGDRIVSVNGTAVRFFEDVRAAIIAAGPGEVPVVVEREGERVELRPELVLRESAAAQGGEAASAAYLGVGPDISAVAVSRSYGPLEAIGHGAARTWDGVVLPAQYIGRIFQGKESGAELGGPLRIADAAGEVVAISWRSGSADGMMSGALATLVNLIMLAGALSVAIGMVNLLPIPILDGGHLVYYAYEAVAGRPLGEGAQEWGFRIGLAMVMGLMVFAFWNDLKYLRVFETIGQILS